MPTRQIRMLTAHPIGGRLRKAGETLYLDRKTAEFLIQTGIAVEVVKIIVWTATQWNRFRRLHRGQFSN